MPPYNLLCCGHSWWVRLAKQETLTPPGHLDSPLVCRGPWMFIVVLYCWCHSDNAWVFFCNLHWYQVYMNEACKISFEFQNKSYPSVNPNQVYSSSGPFAPELVMFPDCEHPSVLLFSSLYKYPPYTLFCPMWDLNLFLYWDHSVLNLSCFWTFNSERPWYFYYSCHNDYCLSNWSIEGEKYYIPQH